MDITSSKFEISNSDVKKCPATCYHEYAFIGRSNGGKLSPNHFVTQHTEEHDIVDPGQNNPTLINHFLINGSWYIVDLPGYGYAQRGKRSSSGRYVALSRNIYSTDSR